MNPVTVMLLTLAMGATVDAPMAPESVVRAMFDAFNRHDAEAMARLYAADARLVSSDFCGPRTGRAEVARTYRELFAAFPDIRDDIEQVVVQGSQVAVRFVARSRAGGTPLHLPISTFVTVKRGRIVSDDSTFDTGGHPCVP